jgi:hypothetical protein
MLDVGEPCLFLTDRFLEAKYPFLVMANKFQHIMAISTFKTFKRLIQNLIVQHPFTISYFTIIFSSHITFSDLIIISHFLSLQSR